MSEQLQNKNVYFITGGGTGGHIYPAIAVADELLKNPDNQIFYIGNPLNMEFNIVKGKGYKFLPVKIKGMPRKLGFELPIWIIQLILATLKSVFYILKYKPKAIFGTGGYVSAPTLIAAAFFTKTPFMMHDCDAQPGLVTRKLSPYAKAVNLAFDSASKFINNKNIFTFGNPIRDNFKTITKMTVKENLKLDDKITICIMGGSQGAQSINNVAAGILKKLSLNNLQIIFQTGKKNYDKTLELILKTYPEYKNDKNIIVRPYFDNMAEVLKASDIVISRAGSLSISEICAVPAASILVPYPYAAADHQRKNARYMEEKGASLYIENDELSPNTLYNKIMSIVDNRDLMTSLTESARKLSNLNATEEIADVLKKIG